MKFKWLSGDFVAGYNAALSKLKISQKELDKKHDIIIGEIVKRETKRLEKTILVEFEVGSQVVNSHGNVGTIVGTHIELSVETHGLSDMGQLAAGPNRYWNIENSDDEAAVTCDGNMLRLYSVKFNANPISKDYGIDDDIQTMFADEFEAVKEE
jgi:hypothetical protein